MNIKMTPSGSYLGTGLGPGIPTTQHVSPGAGTQSSSRSSQRARQHAADLQEQHRHRYVLGGRNRAHLCEASKVRTHLMASKLCKLTCARIPFSSRLCHGVTSYGH